MSLATTHRAGTYDDGVLLTSSEDKAAEIRAKIVSNQLRDHRFFLTLAILAALMIFWGFSRTYYFKPLQSLGALPRSPELSLLVHVHGAVFTLWVVFYLFQTALISKGRRTLHMTLGWASVVLIPAMVILGIVTAFYGAKMGHKQVWPDPESAALVNIDPAVMFGLFAGTGILLRKKSEAHRRLMSLSLVALLPAAVARSPIATWAPPAVAGVVFAFLLAGPIHDLVTRRRIHPAYIFGVVLFLATAPPAMVTLGSTPIWRHFVHWVISA